MLLSTYDLIFLSFSSYAELLPLECTLDLVGGLTQPPDSRQRPRKVCFFPSFLGYVSRIGKRMLYFYPALPEITKPERIVRRMRSTSNSFTQSSTRH